MTEEDREVSENEATEVEELDVETLKQALAEEKEKAEKYLANWQRAEADFSNYKKRAEQEKSELANSANAGLILGVLPVLDDLERALASLPPKLAGLTWVDGIRLIHRKLQAILEIQGLSEIEAARKPFDPSLHEAVGYQEGEEGMVIEEVQKGYKLKDKVLRPALVVVGKGKEEKAEEEKPEEATEV